MNYQFKGNLRGYLCDDCEEFLTGVIVRIYAAQDNDRIVERVVADVKETFHQISEEESRAKANRLLGTATVDEQGNFSISEFAKGYSGQAFDIDFECGNVPPRIPRKKKYPPLFFHITTIQPQWREVQTTNAAAQQQTLFYNWSYAIPNRWWCWIRGRFDEYVICGTVVDCETKVPLKGLKVSAFDVDLIQDDALGFAITDANGKFKLYYTEADFSKTIFSWLNVEWPAGPDLYFKIETATGDVLLQEDRTRGRQNDRNNRGHCFCVKFCVNFKPDVDYVPALFTHVGAYSIVNDFDAQGYTNDAEKNAFTQSIPLVGILPGGNASNSMEYRFKVKNLDTAVEVIADASYLNAFQIGTLTKISSFIPLVYTIDPYYVNNPAGTFNVVIQPGGWIEVPRENSLLGSAGQFNAGTLLGSLNTEMLTKEFFDLTVPSIYKAGDAFPAGQKAGIHTFQIIFEAREVGSSTISYSTVLSKIVMSNVTYSQIVHPSWAGGLRTKIGVGMLEIAETTATGSGCNKIEDTLTANYSVVHPHLENVTISFEGNPPLPATVNPGFSGAGEAVGNHAFTGLNALPMKPCAYIIHLHGNIRLTSGYGRLNWAYVEDHIAFCKA
jgi:hypothetical protein